MMPLLCDTIAGTPVGWLPDHGTHRKPVVALLASEPLPTTRSAPAGILILPPASIHIRSFVAVNPVLPAAVWKCISPFDLIRMMPLAGVVHISPHAVPPES